MKNKDDDGIKNESAYVEHMERLKKNPPNQIERLRLQASGALSELRELAKSDLKALDVLAKELKLQVRELNSDAWKRPEHYRQLARKCATWPAVVSVDKQFQNDQLLFAQRIELGANAPLNYSGKQWSRRTPEIVAALRLIAWIQRRGDKLPPLTRNTAGQWWKHARPMFEQLYGKQFEQSQLFSSKYAKKRKDAGLNQVTWQRKQILSKMSQAFRTLARKS